MTFRCAVHLLKVHQALVLCRFDRGEGRNNSLLGTNCEIALSGSLVGGHIDVLRMAAENSREQSGSTSAFGGLPTLASGRSLSIELKGGSWSSRWRHMSLNELQDLAIFSHLTHAFPPPVARLAGLRI